MRLGPVLKKWLPAIAWAGVISGLSTDTFSSEHTSLFILPVLHCDGTRFKAASEQVRISTPGWPTHSCYYSRTYTRE